MAGAKVIGINARNLKDLKVDVNKYNELAADLPDDVIRVAESGVFGSVELEDYAVPARMRCWWEKAWPPRPTMSRQWND